MVSPLARRSAVKHLTKRDKCSLRRACLLVGMSRSVMGYTARTRRDEVMRISPDHGITEARGLKSEPEEGSPHLESGRAKSTTETAQETPSVSSR